ncbi:MAG TPA: hypothetical protein VG501_03575, partial [Rhizomicrobium sp.]|nr:hypothetical protein [Rhizomicrobium sp.]
KPAAMNPVQAQVESLAAELNANAAPSMKADEAYILGGNEAPAIEEALPEKVVTPIRPNIKPAVFTVESPRPVAAASPTGMSPAGITPAAAVNPVARQVEQLANELNAAAPDDAYTLGGSDAPEIPPSRPSHYPATETVRSTAEMPLAPQRVQKAPEPEKKSSWGFFGRKKMPHDLRKEPYQPPRPQPVSQQPAQPAAQANPASGEDLFPEHQQDEQFEIPAFLRRQSN